VGHGAGAGATGAAELEVELVLDLVLWLLWEALSPFPLYHQQGLPTLFLFILFCVCLFYRHTKTYICVYTNFTFKIFGYDKG
jgi:hypothetical protein